MGEGASPFFADGRWGFMEGWPRRAGSPVFDICHGDQHIARVWKDAGEWRVTLRNHSQVATDLASLIHVLSMVAERMRAFEEQGEEQSVGGPAYVKSNGAGANGASIFAELIEAAVAPAAKGGPAPQ